MKAPTNKDKKDNFKKLPIILKGTLTLNFELGAAY
jgi:hypothetical protein